MCVECRVWEQLRRRASCQTLTVDMAAAYASPRGGDRPASLPAPRNLPPVTNTTVNRELNHPAFQSIRVEQANASSATQRRLIHHPPRAHTVVTLSKLVTPQAVQQCLHFLYTGTIDQRCLELQVWTCDVFMYWHTDKHTYVHLSSHVQTIPSGQCILSIRWLSSHLIV